LNDEGDVGSIFDDEEEEASIFALADVLFTDGSYLRQGTQK